MSNYCMNKGTLRNTVILTVLNCQEALLAKVGPTVPVNLMSARNSKEDLQKLAKLEKTEERIRPGQTNRSELAPIKWC